MPPPALIAGLVVGGIATGVALATLRPWEPQFCSKAEDRWHSFRSSFNDAFENHWQQVRGCLSDVADEVPKRSKRVWQEATGQEDTAITTEATLREIEEFELAYRQEQEMKSRYQAQMTRCGRREGVESVDDKAGIVIAATSTQIRPVIQLDSRLSSRKGLVPSNFTHQSQPAHAKSRITNDYELKTLDHPQQTGGAPDSPRHTFGTHCDQLDACYQSEAEYASERSEKTLLIDVDSNADSTIGGSGDRAWRPSQGAPSYFEEPSLRSLEQPLSPWSEATPSPIEKIGSDLGDEWQKVSPPSPRSP